MKFQVLVSHLSIKSYVFIAAAYKKKKKILEGMHTEC